ncbi:MAG TPA: glycosyltransferase family 2 protein [Microvirga sp.]|nr:glycosyltransferase family 2 protein [Microvirga sp.]
MSAPSALDSARTPDPWSRSHLAREPRRLVHLGSSAAHAYRPAPGAGPWLTLAVEFSPRGVVDGLVEFRFRGGSPAFARPTVVARNSFRIALRAQKTLEEIVLHVSGSGDVHRPLRAALTSSSTPQKLLSLAGVACRRLLSDPRRFLGSAVWFFERLALSQAVSVPAARTALPERDAYERWQDWFDDRPDEDRELYAAQLQRLSDRPTISVLLAPEPDEPLGRAVSAITAQFYPCWELIILSKPGVDIAPPVGRDRRVKVVASTAPTRAGRLNDGLSAASGDIVLALPAWGELRPHALLACALAFAAAPGTALLYADEDVIAADGRRVSPRFKPAWSPGLAACRDYLGDPVFFDARTLRSVGGWREEMAGAADHDVKLRAAEAVAPERIVHLAKILLHRSAAGDAASGDSRWRAVADHIARRGRAGRVIADERSPYPRIVPSLRDPPLVSMIIPTRDGAAILRPCLTSVLARTRYPAYEILLVDNGSQEPETFALFRELASDPRVRILPAPGPFNYSALNNAAARQARGSILALLNNDVEVLAEDWLEEMVGHAVEPEVGCVGAKLYYPNRTLQHAGIVTGLLGGAGHSDKHAAQAARGYLDRLVTVREVSAVTAACLVVRRALYEELGGLDEDVFRIAFNDVDFCLRAAAAGYRNVWTPFAEMIHHESISRGYDLKDRSKARRLAAELAALHDRWGLRLLSDPYHSPHLALDSEAVAVRTS